MANNTILKTSSLISSQIPNFIRNDSSYSNFVSFLEAYYDWMDQSGNAYYESKNLLSYTDIESTSQEFLDYFVKEFLPNFPTEVLIDKRELIKFSKEFYQTKGTLASYKFLFRILYNSEFELFNTKDAVLKASDGTWYIPKSLKLATTDERFLDINNYRVLGETTKSIAVIDNTVQSGNKMEVFISDIERLFQSGEFVRIVDGYNQDVIINGSPLRAKIVGVISQIQIDSKYRGSLYQEGDPVIIYGGLNSPDGKGATARVKTTTEGSIQKIDVVNGGVGYRLSPNTIVSITDAPGAVAIIGSVDPNSSLTANVTLIPTDGVELSQYFKVNANNYTFLFGNPTANANTRLIDAFTFDEFSTYPISSVIATNGGGGIAKIPTVSAESTYIDSNDRLANLHNLGILGPIVIDSGGEGYLVDDEIIFTGGNGYGANAYVSSVNSTGSILTVSYRETGIYPPGGMGYTHDQSPTLSVLSANNAAANASLYISGILGSGATFSVLTDRIGSVSTIELIDGGEDYTSTPNVSLKIQDIVVSNTSIVNLPNKGDLVYQGLESETASYRAIVDSIQLLSADIDPYNSLYNLRVFNYSSKPNPSKPILISNTDISLIMANTAYNTTYDSNGIRIYGDGTARATASFLNGLVIGQGQYLNSRGQLSSFSVLENDVYNNYTYEITVDKEIEKYRSALLNLLHPGGTKVIGRFAMRSNASFNTSTTSAMTTGFPLESYTNYVGTTVTITTDFDNKSNNIINFNNLAGANLAGFVFVNDVIEIETEKNIKLKSEVIAVDATSNRITIKENTWLTFANVAYITGYAGSNALNVISLTGSYDIINNGNYSNTNYPLKDVVYIGDTVKFGNDTPKTVARINYADSIIYLTSNLTSNANSLLSVNRTFDPTNRVVIYGPIGAQYIPELTTEDGLTLTTESGDIILIG